MNRLNRILVATDFSPTSDNAIDHAALIAAKNDAELHVVHVRVQAEPWPDRLAGELFPDALRWQAALVRAAGEAIDGIRPRFVVPVTRAILPAVSAAPAIVDYATTHDVDLVVVGSRGRTGLAHVVLGSVAQMVVRHSPVSVMVVGDVPGHRLREPELGEILSAVDFSPASRQAFTTALALAVRSGARLRAVHVIEDVPRPSFYFIHRAAFLDAMPRIRAHALEELRAWGASAPQVFVDAAVLEGRAPAKIVELARAHDSDLLVVGSTGLGGHAAVSVGSVAERVLRLSPCPVLVVKTSEPLNV